MSSKAEPEPRATDVAGDEPIRLLLADPHDAARAGVRVALEPHGFAIVAEVDSADRAVEAAARERPDLCLLEVRLPGGGIPAAARIVQRVPGALVVMLTSSREDDDLLDAVRVGAAGYLLKSTDPARLPLALRGVLHGEAAIPRVLVTRLVEELQGVGRRRLTIAGRRTARLTPREWLVLDGLRAGADTAEIAERLGVSPVTVRRHVAAVLRKLDVPDRASAVALLAERSAE